MSGLLWSGVARYSYLSGLAWSGTPLWTSLVRRVVNDSDKSRSKVGRLERFFVAQMGRLSIGRMFYMHYRKYNTNFGRPLGGVYTICQQLRNKLATPLRIARPVRE